VADHPNSLLASSTRLARRAGSIVPWGAESFPYGVAPDRPARAALAAVAFLGRLRAVMEEDRRVTLLIRILPFALVFPLIVLGRRIPVGDSHSIYRPTGQMVTGWVANCRSPGAHALPSARGGLPSSGCQATLCVSSARRSRSLRGRICGICR